MKLYDPSALSRQVADFTISGEIPKSTFPEDNADGSRPKMHIAVKGPSQMVALQVLRHLNTEDGQIDFVTEILTDVIKDEPLIKENPDIDLDDPEVEELTERKMTEISVPFREFSFAMNAVMEVDGETTNNEVSLVITAPSALIAIQGFVSLTSPEMLNRLAVNFMPDEHDEDGYDYDDGYDDEDIV